MLRSLKPRRGRTLPRSERFTGLFDQVGSEVHDLMEGWWGPDGLRFSTMELVPGVDVVEFEGAIEVFVDLPGLSPDDVAVDFKDGSLWISGERQEEEEKQEGIYHRAERRFGPFRRILPLPVTVNPDAIQAKFSDGVLRVFVPKAEKSRTKHIEVVS